MSINAAWGLVLLPLFVLVGCASNPVEEKSPEPVLTRAMLDKIRSTRVLIGVDLSSQSQNSQAFISSSGSQLGLIGAIVDVAVSSAFESNRQAHERLMVAIQDAAINFNFGAARRVGSVRRRRA